MKLVLQMTLALLIAFGLVTLGGWALTAALLHQGGKAMSQVLDRSKQEIEQSRQIAERRRLQAEAQEHARAKALREQAVRRKEAELIKARAWRAYYQHPKDCESTKSQARIMECVNQQLRARAQFEHEYSGKPYVMVKRTSVPKGAVIRTVQPDS